MTQEDVLRSTFWEEPTNFPKAFSPNERVGILEGLNAKVEDIRIQGVVGEGETQVQIYIHYSSKLTHHKNKWRRKGRKS